MKSYNYLIWFPFDFDLGLLVYLAKWSPELIDSTSYRSVFVRSQSHTLGLINININKIVPVSK